MASHNLNKQLKEQFVSNLTGSSFTKTFVLLAIVPTSILLRQSFNSYHSIDETSLKKKNDNLVLASKNFWAYIATIVVDFFFIVVPMLLFFTVLSEWAYLGWFLLLLVFFSLTRKRFVISPNVEEGAYSLRPVISSYRVCTMFMTCLCILAVDFRIFPRENAKTETYGTGLMDLGVGSFVVANAIVSRQARNVLSINWKTALKTTSPLILLGFVRLVSTTGVDYQVHVAEYGVHWNFFFTLAGVSILTSIINVPPKYCGILGSVVLIGYQSWLNHGLNVYLLSNERGRDIISQNKEGIFSLFGYWGLYLVGVHLGHYLFFGKGSHSTLRSYNVTFIKVWLVALLLWLLTLLVDRHIERVSRRMCNLAYVTWVLSLNLQCCLVRSIENLETEWHVIAERQCIVVYFSVLMLLGGFMLSQYFPVCRITALEEAFNRNLLASFLLVNITTCLTFISKMLVLLPKLKTLICGVLITSTGQSVHGAGKHVSRYAVCLIDLSSFNLVYVLIYPVYDHCDCRLLWHEVKILVGFHRSIRYSFVR
ncbi:hypothetical protein Patl1_03517 [Pistacia atlantica]|uniref:Uncharacterized protein n=1 Tax=Pistacia atlantica TaxID=434234 RepID=A0ACC1C4C7_9ROSI|nr:hypothetical protein Patl1_03517 [Pistacia atlantica]